MGRMRIKKKEAVIPFRETMAYRMMFAAGSLIIFIVAIYNLVGAVSTNITLAIAFGVIGAAAAFGSGPFFAQGTDGELSLQLYFSFVTLATLGYGDYTAASSFGHTLSIVEAILGQLYLVTVVAVVVSHVGRRPRSDA